MKQKIDPVTKIIEDSYETKPDIDPEFQRFLLTLERRRKFKKQSKIFAKKFLRGLLITGVICIAATSPYFLTNLIRAFFRHGFRDLEREERKMLSDMFTYFSKRGMINIRKSGRQIYISLTKEGKKRARKYQIDDLKIAVPKIWDGKWHILIFDIPEDSQMTREARRGKLKELGFSMLHKSVWVQPYQCGEEVEILRAFFGFKKSNYLLFETNSLGEEEYSLKEIYKIK